MENLQFPFNEPTLLDAFPAISACESIPADDGFSGYRKNGYFDID